MSHWLWYLGGVATLPLGAVVLLAALYVGDAMLYTCGWCIVLWQQYRRDRSNIKMRHVPSSFFRVPFRRLWATITEGVGESTIQFPNGDKWKPYFNYIKSKETSK